MQEIIKEYGSVIITVVAVFALAAMIKILLQDHGDVMEAFVGALESFFDMATNIAGIPSGASTTP